MNYRVQNISNSIKRGTAVVEVPGSKSITARALLLAACAKGISVLHGVQFSDDCATFLKCLTDLGINSEVCGTTVKIEGCSGKLKRSTAEINVGSAGTAARFLPAFLAFNEGKYTLDCSPQMRRRPVSPLINSLREAGAKFEFLNEENSYPFVITGTATPKKQIKVDVKKSSQYLSALLIAAACADKPITVIPSGNHGMDYVKMTVDMMRSFGASVEEGDGEYTVHGGYTAREYDIEPDLSAAAYFAAASRILGADIRVKGVGEKSLQGDKKFLELIKDFNGGRVDLSSFSDQALTLAAVAPYFKEPTEIRGVAHIRLQECDRISAIVNNLTAMGVRVEEYPDGVKIYPSLPQPATIRTYGDHRVAMAFALTGLKAEGIVISDAEVCSKTFKNYFEVLDKLINDLTK